MTFFSSLSHHKLITHADGGKMNKYWKIFVGWLDPILGYSTYAHTLCQLIVNLFHTFYSCCCRSVPGTNMLSKWSTNSLLIYQNSITDVAKNSSQFWIYPSSHRNLHSSQHSASHLGHDGLDIPLCHSFQCHLPVQCWDDKQYYEQNSTYRAS